MGNISQRMQGWFGVDSSYLIKSSFWLNLEKVWRMIADLGIIVLLTRLTSLKLVGEYELLFSIYNLAAVLAITGFNSSLLRSLSTGYDGTLREVLRLSWRWSIMGAAVLAAMGWWCLVYSNAHIGLGLLITAPIFPWYTVLRRWDVVLQAKERFAERSRYYAISSIVILAAVGGAVWLNRSSIVVPFAVMIVGQAGFNIIFFIKVRRLIVNNLIEEGWMKSGYKLFISELFNVLYSRVDRLVLVGWLGLEALAIYAIATKIGEGVKLVLGGMMSAYIPKIYKTGTSEIVRWYKAQGFKIAGVMLSSLAALWVLTPLLIVNLFGMEYRESSGYAQWYLLVIPFHWLASIWGYILIKERREILFTSIGMIAGGANVIAYVVLIPRWGISGAVAGSIIYYILLGSLYSGAVYWLIKKHLFGNKKIL